MLPQAQLLAAALVRSADGSDLYAQLRNHTLGRPSAPLRAPLLLRAFPTHRFQMSAFFKVGLVQHTYATCLRAALCISNLRPPTFAVVELRHHGCDAAGALLQPARGRCSRALLEGK